ncbi:MAG: hypothetical protein WA957_05960 [Alteraurantiacibacter sp.]
MMRSFVMALYLVAAALPAAAQFVTPATDAGGSCPERRSIEPDFFNTFDFRDAHRVELIQRMNTAKAFTKIVETGDCSCENRFPDWDETINYYLEHYAGIQDRHEIYDETTVYRNTINARRLDARAICVSQGNW